MMNISNLKQCGELARKSFKKISQISTAHKNRVLWAIAKSIESNIQEIIDANSLDIDLAEKKGLSPAMIDRLSLRNRIQGLIQDIHMVAELPDPIGATIETTTRPDGLLLTKQRTPLGVLGIIYEARPNVTVDVAVLTIKTSNAAILRGGSETINTNLALIKAIQEALVNEGLPKEIVQLIQCDRAQVKDFLKLHDYIDLIIPRGGAQLHQFCREHSTIPVITGGIGICHLFVDESAELEKALLVIHNAKTQRPTVCNALDTLLVHQSVADTFIPAVIQFLTDSNVSFRLDHQSLDIIQQKGLKEHNVCRLATDDDWNTEWLSLVLGIKVVEDLQEALAHIQTYSSGHSDGILSENKEHQEIFVKAIDSAAVYINASTRFTDGAQFGLGAEVAISTQKIHARGPMGLKELTSYKWIVQGNYHVRS